MTRISVAILNYNGASLLPTYLPSVVRHSPGAEVILIDNASTDGSVEWISKEYPQLRVIRLRENLGYCGGYNIGLEQVDAEVAVLLNSDVEVTEGWLNEPVRMFHEDPSLFAVQPKILRWQERDRFDYAGAGGGFLDSLGYPYCRGRILDQLEQDRGQYNDSCKVMWASGACMFVRSSMFRELGGFETTFFAHMEEIDLCWRAARHGWTIRYCGSSTVFHLGGGTLPVNNPRKTYLNFRNNLSLMFRNLSAVRLLWQIPVRVVLDALAAISFLLRGEAGSSTAVLKAYADLAFGLTGELHRRRLVKGSGYDRKPVKGNITSILWWRHVRGRKRYEG